MTGIKNLLHQIDKAEHCQVIVAYLVRLQISTYYMTAYKFKSIFVWFQHSLFCFSQGTIIILKEILYPVTKLHSASINLEAEIIPPQQNVPRRIRHLILLLSLVRQLYNSC